jgi:hypothetical protein
VKHPLDVLLGALIDELLDVVLGAELLGQGTDVGMPSMPKVKHPLDVVLGALLDVVL